MEQLIDLLNLASERGSKDLYFFHHENGIEVMICGGVPLKEVNYLTHEWYSDLLAYVRANLTCSTKLSRVDSTRGEFEINEIRCTAFILSTEMLSGQMCESLLLTVLSRQGASEQKKALKRSMNE